MKNKTQEKRSFSSPGHLARQTAFAILKRCGQNAPVQALLDEHLRARPLPQSDARLATELVYGFLRKESALNFVLKSMLRAPEKLPPELLLLLGLAAYELSALDRIPARATVHTTVDMVRFHFGEGLAKVGNGVLRSLARKLEETQSLEKLLSSLCDEQALEGIERLSILYSIPLWILTLWSDAYGFKRTEALAAAAACPPWPCVRVNMTRPDWREFRQSLCAPLSTEACSTKPDLPTELSQSLPQALPRTSPDKEPFSSGYKAEMGAQAEAFGLAGIRFPAGGFPQGLHEAIQEGRLSLQGAGSQILLEALFDQNDESMPGLSGKGSLCPSDLGCVWDACAGRGGKSLALLEAGFSLFAASDINVSRLKGLREDAKRLGLVLPALFCASACEPPVHLEKRPQVILLDVPCSGLGTLARHPDMRRIRRPADLPTLAALQKTMLEACWELLPAGGHLVYMTCTVNPAENEEQIRNFLMRHPRAQLIRDWSNEPDQAGTDLMYGARLLKTDVSEIR